MDNIFVERLWRSLKYEEVDLNPYASVAEAKAGIGSWLEFYNAERQHQRLGYRTPRQVYEAQCRWICGRSASPTGCAFAHIPTGTTTNHRMDIDEEEDRSGAMTVAIARSGSVRKSAGLHLRRRLRLSHDRGPPHSLPTPLHPEGRSLIAAPSSRPFTSPARVMVLFAVSARRRNIWSGPEDRHCKVHNGLTLITRPPARRAIA